MSTINKLFQKIILKINRITGKSGNSANNETRNLSGRRAAIMDALNRSIEVFSAKKEEIFEETMANGIQPFADAVGLDRVVFYTLVEKDGKKRLGQVYRWDKSEGGLMSLAEELKVLPHNPVLEEWISITSKGGCVRFRKSDYTEDTAALLSNYGVLSILIIPVFTRGKFWGVINFQDHTNDRYFDEDCADLLYSAARIFSSAIIMEGMTCSSINAVEALKRRERMMDTLNRAAVMFLSQNEETFEKTMTIGIGEIADMFDLDRFAIWRNIIMPDSLQVSQIYRWDRLSGGTTETTKGLENVTYARLAPRWEKLLASGETINSPVRLLPEAATLQSFGSVSVFVTPIFINNIFWGFALLEDRRNERFFEEDSVDMMRSAAFLCANTVIRADMEREIAYANELTRAILDASPLCFIVFDENARAIDCNDASLKTFGTTKKYHLDHFYEFSPEYQSDGAKSGEKAVELIKKALGGEKQVFEWMHRSVSGELIPFEVTLTRTKHNGKYVALGYQYDLRNTKKMLESIREQGEQLKIRLEQQELISELSRGFISSGDSQTLVKEAVAKLGHYHDVTLVFVFAMDYELRDTHLAYYWCADGAPPRNAITNLFEYLTAIFPENLPEYFAIPIVACDDTAANPEAVFQALYRINIMAVIGAPLYVDGRLWGVVCVEQASSLRKWTENEKGFVAMTASTIAGIIMRDIYTVKLKEALHKATEASKAKSEFLSNMSHEMRTPLNAITGMTAIGKSAKDMERKDYALDKIEDASTHLLGVINDVLDMSKIEANMLELSPVEFNFEKMLQKVVAVVNFRVDEKRQKLVVHIDRKIPQILKADDQRLAQVVTNLLSNAVKFTPEEGSITLETRCMGEEKGIFTIQISVSDTGIGISGEQQKRLFSSFQQAESSTTRKYGGTGLGLAISKSIVEMMGGTIRVQSEPEKGSTFNFTIQAARGAESKHKRLLDVKLNNVRIMAVDDDPDILAYFLNIAQDFGISCDTAINGEEALKLINQKGDYNIYFIDWRMPVMDGIRLANEIKARRPENSIVIMISAAEWSAIAQEAREAGVDKFLPKPLFSSTIADIINECLDTDKQQPEEARTEDIEGIFTGRRILLAEDVEINREIVLALLEPTRLEIDCAENGAVAVYKFAEAPLKYDLIFMDVQMPEMDGYEATKRIRVIEAELRNDGNLHKQIPIIAMTANVFREDIDKCFAAGMDSHIGKPLDFEEVIDKLRAYLV
ncbi:MAG: response regulator [Treponema sp.]|jgi:signal transduction histidine kinase/DNA-binding response OmpR family regulator/PAS domain-containing protein|nr:response regulator [Treponema sp.]